MRKIVLALSIVVCFVYNSYAQGGLFGYGEVSDEEYYGSTYWAINENNRSQGLLPLLPAHGSLENETAPLGSGCLLLIGFGVAFALKSRKTKENFR